MAVGSGADSHHNRSRFKVECICRAPKVRWNVREKLLVVGGKIASSPAKCELNYVLKHAEKKVTATQGNSKDDLAGEY